MSNLNIIGSVIYPPGRWGLALPVTDATVTVFDRDLPGRTDDLILSGTTNSEGKFSGSAAEWRDRLAGLPDPSDAPMFSVVVEDRHGHRFSAPALPAPALFGKVALPPVVVPWFPGDPVTVNGKICDTPVAVIEEVARLLVSAEPGFELVVPKLAAPELTALHESRTSRSAWIAEHLPGFGDAIAALDRAAQSDARSDGGVSAIVALGVMALLVLVGTAMLTLAASVGIALILGLILGYEIDFGSDMGAGTGTEVGGSGSQKFRIKFTKPARTVR